jgi:hypothetical protein
MKEQEREVGPAGEGRGEPPDGLVGGAVLREWDKLHAVSLPGVRGRGCYHPAREGWFPRPVCPRMSGFVHPTVGRTPSRDEGDEGDDDDDDADDRCRTRTNPDKPGPKD